VTVTPRWLTTARLAEPKEETLEDTLTPRWMREKAKLIGLDAMAEAEPGTREISFEQTPPDHTEIIASEAPAALEAAMELPPPPAIDDEDTEPMLAITEFPVEAEVKVEAEAVEVPVEAPVEAEAEAEVVEAPVEAEVEAEADIFEAPVEAEVEVEAEVFEVPVEAEAEVFEAPVEAEAEAEAEVVEAPVEAEVEAEAEVFEVPVEAEAEVVEAEVEVEAEVFEAPVEAEAEAEAEVFEAPVEAEVEIEVEAFEAPVEAEVEAEIEAFEAPDIGLSDATGVNLGSDAKTEDAEPTDVVEWLREPVEEDDEVSSATGIKEAGSPAWLREAVDAPEESDVSLEADPPDQSQAPPAE
jgi:hypothetical protein